jgi:DNA-binding NarL/FixJ family response regulator
MGEQKPRVAIIAAALLTRDRIRTALDRPEVQVVGEAPTLSAWQFAEDEVDVLVLAGEPAAGGLHDHEVVDVGLLVLADDHRLPAVRTMLAETGARGWGALPSDAPAADIAAAVVAVARGLVVLPASLDRRPRAARPGDDDADTGMDDLAQEPLTPRELEVLQLVSLGMTNKEIGRQLGISEHTVKFHVSSICGKLRAASRTEAVRLGVRLGLVTL